MFPFPFVNPPIIYDPPGSATYTSPGTYTLIVPKYRDGFTVQIGGGGGGAGSVNNQGGEQYGGAGGTSTISALGLIAYGGSGAMRYGMTAVGGSASGGSTNLAGGNNSGITPGSGAWPGLGTSTGRGGIGIIHSYYGYDTVEYAWAYAGAGGGYCARTYARDALTPGAILTIVVGGAGAAGAAGGDWVSGTNGLAGRAQISWT